MPTFNYSTIAQLRTRLRQRYQAATQLEVGKLAAFFLTLTDNQLKAVFGVDDVQLVTLKTRLQNRKEDYDAVKDAVGE